MYELITKKSKNMKHEWTSLYLLSLDLMWQRYRFSIE